MFNELADAFVAGYVDAMDEMEKVAAPRWLREAQKLNKNYTRTALKDKFNVVSASDIDNTINSAFKDNGAKWQKAADLAKVRTAQENAAYQYGRASNMRNAYAHNRISSAAQFTRDRAGLPSFNRSLARDLINTNRSRAGRTRYNFMGGM